MTQNNTIYFPGIGEISYNDGLGRELLIKSLKKYCIRDRLESEILLEGKGHVGFEEKSYLIWIRNGQFFSEQYKR